MRKRKTISVYPDEYMILKKAKRAFEVRRGRGQARWGDFLSLLATGYLIGHGILKIKDLEERYKEKKQKKEV